MSDNLEGKNDLSANMPPQSSDNEDMQAPETTVSKDVGGTTKDVKQDAQVALNALPVLDSEEAAEGTNEIDLSEAGNTTSNLQQEAIKAEKERLEREQANAEGLPFDDDMMLRLDIVESNQPIILEVGGDLIVGRADNVTDYTPEIDLTPHGAYRLGLSRRHALIRRQEKTLLVKDLSSRNGTFVNGEQVKAGGTHPLCDGDELRFGNLTLRVNFQRKN
ncbi:MAG: FHA domain-containing protein [Anaerolineae bacterium]|nr:FHA domain-containing protein [Anaerolineae bacterium]